MDIQPTVYDLETHIAFIDWFVLIAFTVITIVIGLYYSRRGTKSVSDYFASGQGMPWWILGTSMVATAFAADTPLAISGLVVTQGIWGNWFYWSQVPQFILGVYFFSRLWRRARILTDNELIDVRYCGKPARLLRGFRALFFALPYNSITLGFVILPLTNILNMTFEMPKLWAIIISIFITVSYSLTSGLWGVMITSFFQFFLAIGMMIFLAVVAVNAVGGFGTMLEKLPEIYGADKADTMLDIIPAMDAPNFGFIIFMLYICLAWWSTGPTDGGAYFAQRMISAKNEKHSFLGYLWFNVWHVVLRPWPWIIVGIAAAILFPGIAQKNPVTGELVRNPEMGYIAVMLTYLKPGLLGLMLAGFLAAFMSTVSAQINWGASYLINDFYRPFIKKDASEKHYIRASFVSVIFAAILAGVVSYFMTSIFTGWLLLWAINAGIGVVYIMRWYWWRINAWSEITAIGGTLCTIAIILFIKSEMWLKTFLITEIVITSAVLVIWGLRKKEWREKYLKSSIFIIFIIVISVIIVFTITLPEKKFPWTTIYTLPLSAAIWLTATMLTKPTDEKTLIEFYKRTHPGGPGWKRIAAKIKDDYSAGYLYNKRNVIGAIFAIIGTYTALIGFGNIILGDLTLGIALMGVMAVSIFIVVKNLYTEKWERTPSISGPNK